MPEHRVQALLTAWRDAERALDEATDPDHRADLEMLVASLRDEYRRAVQAIADQDVHAHGDDDASD